MGGTHTGQEQRMTFRLLSYWSRVRAGRTMPPLENVNLSEMRDISDFTFTKCVVGGREPYFTYFGSRLIESFGKDFTGESLFDASADVMIDNMIGFYEKVLISKQPNSQSSEFYVEGKEIRYRSIILPCSANDFNVDYLIGTTNYKIFV